MHQNKILPLHSRVLVQLIEVPSNIVIPDTVAPVTDARWKVLATGPDVICCVSGDVVMLVPDFNIIITDDAKRIGLVDHSSIVARFL